MGQMCCRSYSLYNAKLCDGCGRCGYADEDDGFHDEIFDDYDELAAEIAREEEYFGE